MGCARRIGRAVAWLLISGGLSSISPEKVWPQDLVISEFVAVNDTIALDEDGDSSDLIELYNPGPRAVDLEAWSLTDDAASLLKWRFPRSAPEIAAGEYLVVFASGKDRVGVGGELHTNFRLSAGGEYLALVRPDATIAHHYAPEYPEQFADISYGIAAFPGDEFRYFLQPTPGEANHQNGVVAFVADTKFSVDRGYYDQPFEVAVNTATPGAEIYYTVDGSEPVPVGSVDILLVDDGADVRVLVPPDDTLGLGWTQLDFDASTWRAGQTGVGFELGSGLEGQVRLDVGEEMFEVATSVYLRVEFSIESPETDFLVLGMKYDDGFVAYLNGEFVASGHAPQDPRWDSRATRSRSDRDAVEFEEVDLTDKTGLLRAGRNVLAIHGLNKRPSDRDLLVSPRLVLPAQWPRPAGGESFRYAGPIQIATTTVLRAAAYKEGYGPTDVDTHTYLFVDDVLTQDGAGFPDRWASQTADYAMDRNVVTDPAYRDSIRDDLKSIPVLSLVMNPEDLFGPTNGIYSFPTSRGIEWERSCSMEFFFPESLQESIQVNCGVRMYGFWSRRPDANDKHSLRLLFKRRYGPSKLNFRLFPDWDVQRFNTIILGAQGDRQWTTGDASEARQSQYLRDAWCRYTARDMGKMTTSLTYVHLYLNGLYWGLYQPRERPDADFMEDHLGGDAADYDSLNARTGDLEVIDGTLESWNEVMRTARSGLASPAAYEEMQRLVDVPDLISYMLINFYTGNHDWTGANGNNLRVAGAPEAGVPFKSFVWDMEITFLQSGDNSVNVNRSFNTPATVHAFLAANEEYTVLFGDRVHQHFFNGGTLTPSAVAQRWMELAGKIERAVVGESARWGDNRREPPYTRDVEWLGEQKRLLTQVFPVRTSIVLEQLRSAGLYPGIEAPIFNQHGGRVERGFGLLMLAPVGRIFYTLDGADPRLAGGELSPEALEFPGGDGLDHAHLVEPGAEVRVLVPHDDRLGLDWTGMDYDDSDWLQGRTGVGYERRTGYEDEILTDVGDSMFETNTSVYLRVEFVLEDSDFDFLWLDMKYDDGFVAYLNGELLASVNAPEEPQWNSASTRSHPDSQAAEFEEFDVIEQRGLLRSGRNVLAVHGLNKRANDGDMLILPRLRAGAFVGDPIVIEAATVVRARALVEGEWSALTEASFVTDEEQGTEEGLQLPGDLTQDAKLNITDVVGLLSLLTGGGRFAPPCEGDSPVGGSNQTLLDLNGDGGADVADAVYLLNYLFRQGPPPAMGTECVPIEGCPDVRCL